MKASCSRRFPPLGCGNQGSETAVLSGAGQGNTLTPVRSRLTVTASDLWPTGGGVCVRERHGVPLPRARGQGRLRARHRLGHQLRLLDARHLRVGGRRLQPQDGLSGGGGHRTLRTHRTTVPTRPQTRPPLTRSPALLSSRLTVGFKRQLTLLDISFSIAIFEY